MNVKINAIIIYICIAGLIVYIRPKLMFDTSNSIKQFGIKENQTICTFPVCMIIFAISIYLLLTIVYYK
jgi:hypothetical protein